MKTAWLATGLVLLTARWWWVLLSQLLRDIHAAGSPLQEGGPRRLSEPGRASPRGFAPALRPTPLNRRLAFRGVQRRVAARRRWEGGFGRRRP